MKINKNTILQQVFSIPLDDARYLIYAPLKGIAFIGNPALVNFIYEDCLHSDPVPPNRPTTPLNTSNRDEIEPDNLSFLHRLGFFKPESPPPDEYQQKGIQYDAVILFLTNQCNLRCSYCYASSGENNPKEMPWEIAQSAIGQVMSEVIKNKSSAMTLGFHGGGEPTLNWDILTRATDYTRSLAAKHNVPLHVTGSFNGYWSKKVCNYVIHNFTELSISFDGLPFIQNHQRPTRGKGNSFPKVAKTLQALDEVQFPYGIRMTVTKDSVHHLAEGVSYICENFRPRKIQVEPVFPEGRARRNGSMITDLNVFIEQFIRGIREAEKYHIALFYSGARLEPLTKRFCLAACRALIITPDGDVTTCFETYSREHPLSQKFIVGSYNKRGQFSIDNVKLRSHFSHTVQNISYCESCFCKWHCAGDCATKTSSNGSEGGHYPTDRCLVNQELTKFMILKRIKESEGLIWIDENKESIERREGDEQI